MKLEPQDKITEIYFNERDDTAAIYTHNKYMMRRLEKLAHDRPGECQIIEYTNEGRAIRCSVPKEWVRLYLGAGRTLNLSEADRKAKADRLRMYSHNRRKSGGLP